MTGSHMPAEGERCGCRGESPRTVPGRRCTVNRPVGARRSSPEGEFRGPAAPYLCRCAFSLHGVEFGTAGKTRVTAERQRAFTAEFRERAARIVAEAETGRPTPETPQDPGIDETTPTNGTRRPVPSPGACAERQTAFRQEIRVVLKPVDVGRGDHPRLRQSSVTHPHDRDTPELQPFARVHRADPPPRPGRRARHLAAVPARTSPASNRSTALPGTLSNRVLTPISPARHRRRAARRRRDPLPGRGRDLLTGDA